MNRGRAVIYVRVLLAAAFCLSACAIQRAKVNVALDSNEPRLIWRSPGHIPSRDLFYGPGGPQNVPSGTFKFLEEITNGASPKFDVEDAQGMRWRVKPGPEARPETAATRLLWAVGYFADEDYFVPELRVKGLKKTTLARGQLYVVRDGVIAGVRVERHPKDRKKIGNWDWRKNPFAGTRELNGLRVMMALLNNSDIKPINNAIYEVKGEYHYAVSDLGASFGRTGTALSQSKDDLSDYRKARFIAKTTPEDVHFVLIGRPAPVDVLFWPLYLKQRQRENIVQHIPREHARWLGGLLGQLSTQQLHDCFRAAGYMPEEAAGYTVALKQRIAQLNRL